MHMHVCQATSVSLSRRSRGGLRISLPIRICRGMNAIESFQTIRVVVNRSASARIQSMNVLAPGRSLARVGQTNQ